MKLDDIRAVYQTIEGGRWIGGIPFPGFGGVKLQVRGLRNSDYQRKFGEMTAALTPEKRDADGLPVASEREAIIDACLRDTVLLGWEGIEDAFTPESVMKTFADTILGPAFRDAVFWCATEVAKQAGATLEQDVKN